MRYLFLVSILFLFSCKKSETELTAQEIIDKTIVSSGADKVSNSKITFQFRNIKYLATRKDGKFLYSKEFDSINDVLTNTGFQRFINGKEAEIDDDLVTKYSNSINSVHYFSVLPYGLN
ncbi:MAG: deoxyribose-phosphate aldolase, partial [Polaribacter sp.]